MSFIFEVYKRNKVEKGTLTWPYKMLFMAIVYALASTILHILMIDKEVHDNIMQRVLVVISKPTYDLHNLLCLASMNHWYLHALMADALVSQEHIVELIFIMSFECVCIKTILLPVCHSKYWAKIANSAHWVILCIAWRLYKTLSWSDFKAFMRIGCLILAQPLSCIYLQACSCSWIA